ncbi:MAG TPA: helix-turn-helix domain-containing protein [Gaiellales bacterium]|jgi:excisionase family DNA binding protein|nr:helix-turn-helix domain-containing protein [Gaiellales bacterium]
MRTTAGSPFLKIPEVAAELRVDRATVYRLIRRGQLPTVQIGTGRGPGQILRVRADAFERFIADRETKSCRAL